MKYIMILDDLMFADGSEIINLKDKILELQDAEYGTAHCYVGHGKYKGLLIYGGEGKGYKLIDPMAELNEIKI